MISAIYYQTIFLTFVTITTIIVLSSTYSQKQITTAQASNTKIAFIIAAIMIVFIGYRPVDKVFVDMFDTFDYYEYIKFNKFSFKWETDNLLYDNIYNFFAQNGLPFSLFTVFMASLYFGCTYFACRKIFPYDTLIAYLVWLGAFSTFSYATNGFKAGAAASIFLFGIAYKDKKIISILLVLISVGMHHSMIICAVAFFCALLYQNIKAYIYIWLFCLLIAVFHITVFQELFARMTDEQGAQYLIVDSDEWINRLGFRFDFVLYSACPIIVGWYTIIKKRIESKTYNFLLSIYIICNCVWLLCMYAKFNNRIAYLSWCIYPIVLIYPFLNTKVGNDRFKKFNKIGLGHLAFTLFMEIVYYGILSLGR